MILLANSVLEHVIPAKAGIQRLANISYVYIEDLCDGLIGQLDSSLRWNDMLFHINMGKEQFYKGEYMNSPTVSFLPRLFF